ncbi:MAG TPA: YHS domain-containing protein [Stellaceae bacterium]|nr:YHS domain-containing protein [Stellaceae bacterium]
MDWLSQNWIWIPLAIGGFFVVSRMGMGGCGIGGGCGMGSSMGNSHGSGSGSDGQPVKQETSSGPAVDPVSRQALLADAAISSVYQGRAYYFESRENRDTFESAPEKYLAALPSGGQAIGAKSAQAARSRREGGCC